MPQRIQFEWIASRYSYVISNNIQLLQAQEALQLELLDDVCGMDARGGCTKWISWGYVGWIMIELRQKKVICSFLESIQTGV